MKNTTAKNSTGKPWRRRRTARFGKIDYMDSGRRINEVEVEVELRDEIGDGRIALSVRGAIWNARKTKCVAAGQCLDGIAKFVDGPEFRKILGWWRKYHLNDMHAGDERQEAYLKEAGIGRGADDYDKALAALRAAGLEKDSEGYVYGSRWHWHPIGDEDLREMLEFVGDGERRRA